MLYILDVKLRRGRSATLQYLSIDVFARLEPAHSLAAAG